jgi:hypothetical protein
MMAYSNDFLFMTFISLCAFPLLALIRSPKAVATPASREAAAHGRAFGYGLRLETFALLSEGRRGRRSALRAHQPVRMLGVEHMVMEVGDPLSTGGGQT